MFKGLIKNRATRAITDTDDITSRKMTRISESDIDALIEYALRTIASLPDVASPSSPSGPSDPTNLSLATESYSWMISRVRMWRNPAMTDRKSVSYLFKQVAKHIDALHQLSTNTSGICFTFTEDDCALYTGVVEEYRQLLKVSFVCE